LCDDDVGAVAFSRIVLNLEVVLLVVDDLAAEECGSAKIENRRRRGRGMSEESIPKERG